MQEAICLNCNEDLNPAQKFCSSCGQKANIYRLTTKEIFHQALHAITHADKGLFSVIKDLAIKPGIVAKEYIEGKRKKYFNPYSLLVIVTGIVLVISSNFQIFGYSVNKVSPKDTVYSNSNAPTRNSDIMVNRAKEGYLRRSAQFTSFVNNHSNVVLFISTPFLSFFLWLFYRKRKMFYAEHLTSMAFFNSFMLMYTALIFAPLIYFTRNSVGYGVYIVPMLLSHVIYLAFAHKQLFDYKGIFGFLKTFGISLLAVFCWVFFSMIVGMSYIFWGG